MTVMLKLINKNLINSAAHITGGGLIENITRSIPSNLSINIDLSKIKTNRIFKWLKSMGGVSEMEKLNNKKAKKLYSFIDQSDFYKNKIKKEDRSIMNIPFQLNNKDLDTRNDWSNSIKTILPNGMTEEDLDDMSKDWEAKREENIKKRINRYYKNGNTQDI